MQVQLPELQLTHNFRAKAMSTGSTGVGFTFWFCYFLAGFLGYPMDVIEGVGHLPEFSKNGMGILGDSSQLRAGYRGGGR
jgi:hypothetical protein